MRRRSSSAECVHAPPMVFRGAVVLDWHDHAVARWPGSCRICKGPTILLDCVGLLCHKVCAEREATRKYLAPASRAGARSGRGPVDRRHLVAIDGGR